MIKAALTRAAMAAAIVISLPTTALGQDEPASPEGIEWHLSGYALGGEMIAAPWPVDTTLLLEGGTASGSTGCNSFSGAYQLEAETLVFDPALATTRAACEDAAATVETEFLSRLPRTASWSITDDVLTLDDAEGAALLTFEQAVVALTPSDIAALRLQLEAQQDDIERANERIDNVRIGTLRDRIKTLESQVQTLRSQAAASSSSGGSSRYSSAETVLLKGVPARIANTCEPLRGSGLPSGTVAALQCQPKSGLVTDMAYYLMEYEDGERTFQRVMNAQGVPDRLRCEQGRSGRALLHPLAAEGCFRDGGKANVRIMYMATACRQLDAGGTHLVSPVIYVAAEGSGSDIKALYEWTRAPNRASSVTGTIPAAGQPTTPVCEGDF